jgi:hypothetical protein
MGTVMYPGKMVPALNWAIGLEDSVRHENNLSAECKAKLNTIVFAWELSCKTAWDTHFEQLEKYKKADGDCNAKGYPIC